MTFAQGGGARNICPGNNLERKQVRGSRSLEGEIAGLMGGLVLCRCNASSLCLLVQSLCMDRTSRNKRGASETVTAPWIYGSVLQKQTRCQVNEMVSVLETRDLCIGLLEVETISVSNRSAIGAQLSWPLWMGLASYTHEVQVPSGVLEIYGLVLQKQTNFVSLLAKVCSGSLRRASIYVQMSGSGLHTGSTVGRTSDDIFLRDFCSASR